MAIRRANDGSGMVVADITTTDSLSEKLGALGVVQLDGSGNQIGTTASPEVVQGNVASGATDSGNPVKVGGRYNATLPTLTDGQRGDMQIGTRGSLSVQLMGPDATTQVSVSAVNSDGATSSSAGVLTRGYAYGYNGTTWDRVRGDTNGLAVQPALSANFWNYAAASGGIVNTTTAVTVKAAAGASVRNYIMSIQVSHDTLGAVTELAIRDGAAGTVLWRGKLQTAATDLSGGTINFDPPLKGTANTLVEIVTLTAVTGGVYCNLQGYTGA